MKQSILALSLMLVLPTSFAAEQKHCLEGACPALPEAGAVSHDSEINARNIGLLEGGRPLAPDSEMLLPDEQFTFWGLDQVVSSGDGKTITVKREISETQSVAHKQAIEPIKFRSGKHAIDSRFVEKLRNVISRLSHLTNLRLRFIGHTDSQRLSARARAIYGDNYGLGKARAKRAADYFRDKLGLDERVFSYEGKGPDEPLASNDTPEGMAKNRRVEIQVWYDKTTTRTVEEEKFIPAEPLARTSLCRKQGEPTNAYSMTPWRVSLDGAPLNEEHPRHGADAQRCTDVALEKTQIQLQYDNLQVEAKLNVTAWPNLAVPGQQISFRGWSNYPHWIKRSELIITRHAYNDRRETIASIELDDRQEARWQVPAKQKGQLWYLLRVYDEQGRFDETEPKPLPLADSHPSGAPDPVQRETTLRAGYGKQNRSIQNIPVQGGTITVNGRNVPADHEVWVMDQLVPLDENNAFVAQQIIPTDLHTAEVAVLDESGNGELFWRDLELKRNDWFYVGIADLTLGLNKTSGSPSLVTGDDELYEESSAHGRIAFYAKGKVKEKYTVTTSVDSREEPLDELFSNFDKKDPRSLLRRLDSEDYYPTFGDDSTLVEDAPTQGKFYAKIDDGKSHAMWGNFKLNLAGNELTRINRGLYGAHGRFQSEASTSFGERRTRIDLFAAEPGTIPAHEQFRGTGGSLYYLRHRDITRGSEQVHVQIRDKDSDILLSSKTLVAGQDYDLDELQGILLLTNPLPSSADDSALVQAGNLSGNPVYLLIGYEYVPGFSDPDLLTVGGRAEHWFNDNIQLGLTANNQEQDGGDQELAGIDLTLRKSERSWIKLLAAQSEGPGVIEQQSVDGGFDFIGQATANRDEEAEAQRVEGAFDLRDIGVDAAVQGSFYLQKREAGYSAPGQQTRRDTLEQGIKVHAPLNDSTGLELRYDARDEKDGRDKEALEADLKHQLNEHWGIGIGLRADEQDDDINVATRDQGVRTDLALRAEYQSYENWDLHGFVQGTLDKDSSRKENNRAGIGGGWQVSERLKLTTRLSDGNLGPAVTAGADYQVSDQTSLYLNYGLDSDNPGTEYYSGSKSTVVAGGRSRFSDHASVYAEQKYTHGNQPRGLTQSYGVDLAPSDRWSYGLTLEYGKLETANSGKVDRSAIGMRLGYSHERTRYAGAIEYRNDDSDREERDSWLLRNSYKYQINPDWRLLTRLDLAASKSDQSDYFKGDFVEGVLGYAYRPVANDRWNHLFKYTYFYDLTSPDQLSPSGNNIDYQQRSHILALDSTYDVTKRWTLGGKYAFRRAELRDREGSTQWFRSDAHLIVARADWHLVKRWDLLVEGRILDLVEAKDTRSGALVALYRHVGQHVKVGVGYNFTDFSDDLTNLDYDSHGWFFNIVGKF